MEEVGTLPDYQIGKTPAERTWLTTNVVAGDIAGMASNKTYKVALEDYIASSEYKLPGSVVTDTGNDLSEPLIDDLQECW